MNGEFLSIETAEKLVKLEKENEKLKLILKVLHNHFEKHEEYENNEFLRQLENCERKDCDWLKKVAGE